MAFRPAEPQHLLHELAMDDERAREHGVHEKRRRRAPKRTTASWRRLVGKLFMGVDWSPQVQHDAHGRGVRPNQGHAFPINPTSTSSRTPSSFLPFGISNVPVNKMTAASTSKEEEELAVWLYEKKADRSSPIQRFTCGKLLSFFRDFFLFPSTRWTRT